MIGGEGRDITGDIKVDAYGIDDYFLDSPDCVDKQWIAGGEAEFAFFKLKPLSEPTEPSDPAEPSDPTEPTEPKEEVKDDVAQTGDNSNMMIWLALMVLAAAGATGTAMYRRKA